MSAESFSRLAGKKGRAPLHLPKFPRIKDAAPKMAKAFPEDVQNLQKVLDAWWSESESLIRIAQENAKE